jgi:hypothetical protein
MGKILIMRKDNWSLKGYSGQKIDTGMPWILGVIGNIILLITFPIRAFFYLINPFAAKNVRIKK